MEAELNIGKQDNSLTREQCVEIIEKAGQGCQHIGYATEHLDIRELSLSLLRIVANNLLDAPEGSQTLQYLNPQEYE